MKVYFKSAITITEFQQIPTCLIPTYKEEKCDIPPLSEVSYRMTLKLYHYDEIPYGGYLAVGNLLLLLILLLLLNQKHNQHQMLIMLTTMI